MQQYNDQRSFLDDVKNHAEFKGRLTRLRLTSDFAVFDAAVVDIVGRWFQLARLHAEELGKLDVGQMPRATYESILRCI